MQHEEAEVVMKCLFSSSVTDAARGRLCRNDFLLADIDAALRDIKTTMRAQDTQVRALMRHGNVLARGLQHIEETIMRKEHDAEYFSQTDMRALAQRARQYQQSMRTLDHEFHDVHQTCAWVVEESDRLRGLIHQALTGSAQDPPELH